MRVCVCVCVCVTCLVSVGLLPRGVGASMMAVQVGGLTGRAHGRRGGQSGDEDESEAHLDGSTPVQSGC